MGGLAIQYIDDAHDIAQDASEKSMNLFLGLAHDNGEVGQLLNATQRRGMTRKKLLMSAPVLASNIVSSLIRFQTKLLNPVEEGLLAR
jgi:hypothetical protein